MDTEQLFFLNVLRDHVQEQRTKAPDDLDWEKVSEHAKRHLLEPMIFMQTRNRMFRVAFHTQIVLSSQQEQVIGELEEVLKDIPHFMLKGRTIAAFYPFPELRTMGDIDYYFHEEDREKALVLMESIGVELLRKFTGEWVCRYKGVLLELHTALVYGYSKAVSNKVFYSYFNNCWKYYKDGEIDLDFHVLYLFLHLRKHIMETGIGFRHFMDIAVVTKNAPVHWERIRRIADKLGLLPFIRTVLTFNERWFGVPSPYGTEPMDEEFFEAATLHIFDDGVFGYGNAANHENRAINERKKTGKSLTRAKVLFQHATWSYDKMIEIPGYEWLKGKKILLPAAWVMRTVERLREEKGLLRRYFATSKTVRKRYEYLDKWNIRNEGE